MVALMQPILEDEAVLDPVAAFQPFEVKLLCEQEGQAVSVTLSFAFVSGLSQSRSYWAEPLA